MVRTGCLSQHDKLVPAKHIFGKSAAAWLGLIVHQHWVTDGPASAEMQPPTKKIGSVEGADGAIFWRAGQRFDYAQRCDYAK